MTTLILQMPKLYHSNWKFISFCRLDVSAVEKDNEEKAFKEQETQNRTVSVTTHKEVSVSTPKAKILQVTNTHFCSPLCSLHLIWI
jgi:hypothetical protein